MEWNKTERLDVLSVHDEEWHIESDDGKLSAIGTYSCGDLVRVENIDPK